MNEIEIVMIGAILGVSIGIAFIIGFLFAKKLYHKKPPQYTNSLLDAVEHNHRRFHEHSKRLR